MPPQGKPLTLEQCTAIALKYHPSLRANQAAIEASKARVEQALASYYPQVNFGATYTYSSANFSSAARTGDRNWNMYDFYSFGPTATLNIYDFGRTANNVTVNRENMKASEEDLTTARQLVVLNVKQAFFGVLATLRLIEVAEEVVKQDKLRLEQAQGFYQAGTRPKIDVTKAEVDLANAELNLIRAKNNFQLARVTLNNTMGLQQSLSFAIEDAMDIKPVSITLEEILKLSYAQRPELLQLKARQRSLDATVKLADASYYPTL